MRVVLYLCSGSFLWSALSGITFLMILSEGRHVELLHRHGPFQVASHVFLWGSAIAGPLLALAFGVYLFVLATRYPQDPRRTVRAFLYVVGVVLLLNGVWLAGLAEFLIHEWSPGALLWGTPFVVGGVLVLVSARRYRVGPVPTAAK